MKKLITLAAIAVSMAFAPAHAVLIDFANEADTNGERALIPNGLITIDGISMQIGADTNFGQANAATIFPYLDAGNAGLGACQVIDANRQCNPGSDDNVTTTEGVAIFFTGGAGNVQRSIQGLLFRDANHNIINAANDGMVTIQTQNGTLTDLFSNFILKAAMADAFFQNTIGIRFLNVDKDFYISAIDVSDVPLPAALPLFLSGIAGMGVAARRRKKAAA